LKHFVTFIILSLCLIGCTNNTHDAEWNKIDNCIQRSDTTALQLLRKIGNDKDKFSKADRMRYELLLASAHNKFFVSMESDSTMKDVVDYYSDKGNDNERMEATYLLGCVYRDKGDAPRALEYYEDAVESADTTSSKCNHQLLCRIYAQMALLFQEQRSPKLELGMWNKAIKYAWMAKDTLLALNYIHGLGGAYYMMNRQKDALNNTLLVYNLYKKYGQTEWAADILAPIIDDEINKGKYHDAKKHIDEYRYKSNAFDKQGNLKLGCEPFYIYLGKFYEAVSQKDSAIYYYRKLLLYPSEISNLEEGYKGLMSVYGKMNIPDSIVKYAKLYANANDTANYRHSAEEITRTQALYNYNESQKQAADKASENSRLWFFVYILLFISTIIAGCIYIYLRNLRLRSRKKLADENERYSDILYRYNQLIDELNSIETGISEYQDKKEQEINCLLEKLSIYQDDSSKYEKWNIEQALLSHQTVRRMHELARHAQMPSELEWNDLYDVVSNHLSAFYNYINKPQFDLNHVEIRICILIRLYFIPSELAVLFNIKKQRVTNIRSRINKKLFNKDGTKGIDQRIRNL
jgi:hypothetical protein